jgi:hypothetical protein
VPICTHAAFRFAVESLGIEAFDDRLIAVDEFHHVSPPRDNRLGAQLAAFIDRDKVHIVAMTGSYFRGDAAPVLTPEDEGRFETVSYTYYEPLNGYEHLKALNSRLFFLHGRLCGRDRAMPRSRPQDHRAYPFGQLAHEHQGQGD